MGENSLQVRQDLIKGVFVLGNAEKNLMVKYDERGACRSIKKVVKLLWSKNHFYQVDKNNNIWDYSLSAYKAINKYLNLDDLSPRNFTLDGITYTNPSIKRDSMGRKTLVKGLSVVGGRGPTGKYQIVSRYLEEDIQFGLIQAIIKKMKYKDSADIAEYVIAGSKPREGYQIMPVDDFMSLEVNIKHPEFRRVYSKYVDDLMIGERKLESKVWRNAFKNHPAVLLPACLPIPLFNDEGDCYDYYIDVTLTIWFEEIESDKQEAIDKFFSDLDQQTEIIHQEDVQDETDLSEEQIEELEEVLVEMDESAEEIQAESEVIVMSDEQVKLIKYITEAPIEIDLGSISKKPLEEWSVLQLNIAKDEINKQLEE